MSVFKFSIAPTFVFLNILLFSFFIATSCSVSDEKDKKIEYQNKLAHYMNKLKDAPDNCLYNQQVAVYNSFLGQYNEAILFYEKVINKCPEDIDSVFQLGVTHLLNNNKDMAFLYMDEAIKMSMKAKDKETTEVLKKEKQGWMEYANKRRDKRVGGPKKPGPNGVKP